MENGPGWHTRESVGSTLLQANGLLLFEAGRVKYCQIHNRAVPYKSLKSKLSKKLVVKTPERKPSSSISLI